MKASILFSLTCLCGAEGLRGQDEQPVPPVAPGPIPAVQPAAIPAGSDSVRRGPVARLGVAVRVLVPHETEAFQLKPEFGLVVDFVVEDGPAARAGIEAGDILTQFNDQLLTVPRQLEILVRGSAIGQEITLTRRRHPGEEASIVVVKLDAAPEVMPPVPEDSPGSFRVTDRVVRIYSESESGPHTIAITNREQRAFLEVRDPGGVVFSGAIRSIKEIPTSFRDRVNQVALVREGRWEFRLPLQPPVELAPEEGPSHPAPQAD